MMDGGENGYLHSKMRAKMTKMKMKINNNGGGEGGEGVGIKISWVEKKLKN